MMHRLKSAARRAAPGPVRLAWGHVHGGLKVRRARAAYDGAPALPGAHLPAEMLPVLMARGYRPPDAIRYDADGLVERALDKIARLEARLPLASRRVCVELGCWDGMVLAALAGRGHVACGVDLSRDGFDARARAAGVRLVQSDAASIGLARHSIDLLYSFAAFEHFAAPAGVLREASRVLRPGGYLYLFFGPVYTSPYGLHAYRQIPVPYCHYLFSDHDLRGYALREGLPASWPYVNGVSVTEYRRLLAGVADQFDELFYREHPTGGVGAELIAAHPDCFRAKVPSFGDLLVSAIEVCLRKR